MSSRDLKALTIHPRRCRSNMTMARILSENPNRALRQVIHFVGVRRFGETQRKNSIRLPSDRDAGSYLFGFPTLGNPRNQLSWRKIILSRTDLFPEPLRSLPTGDN